MDIPALIGQWGGSALGIVLPFLFVLTIVVFFHELGHFWVARRCGVKVEVFSIGFGPELFGWTDRQGTRWRVAAVPLGGYVRFFGDADAASTPEFETAQAMDEEERKVSFFHKTVGQRAAIVAAGPIANFILAIVIFALTFMIVGRMVTSARIETVNPASAAERAGFKPGDLVVGVNGKDIESFTDLQRIVSISPGQVLNFTVDRGGSRVELSGTPDQREFKDRFGGTHRVGMLGLTRSSAPGDVTTRRYDPVTAVSMGVKETWFVIERTMSYLVGVVRGRESADQLGGPIRIAQVSGEAAQAGIPALFLLAAVLSVSIGLLNLFPVPMLDGGHLLFYALEAVRGRPLSERAQEYSFRFGLALVLMLMVFATWNDIRGLMG